MATDEAINRKARWLFSGVLALGALVAAGWYLFWSTRYTTYVLNTHDPVSGLIVDSPIEYHGVDVGKVKRVELVDPRSIRIIAAIRDDAPVSRATVATITSRGLATRGFTGYVVIELEDLGSGSGPIVAAAGERYPVIPTQPSKVVNLDLAVAQVTGDVRELNTLVQSVLDQKTVVALKQSIDGLQRVTKTLADNNAKLESIIGAADRAGRELPPLLESSKQTVKMLQTQLLPETYKAMASLEQFTSSLNGFAEKMSKDPSVILRGPGKQALGPGETK